MGKIVFPLLPPPRSNVSHEGSGPKYLLSRHDPSEERKELHGPLRKVWTRKMFHFLEFREAPSLERLNS